MAYESVSDGSDEYRPDDSDTESNEDISQEEETGTRIRTKFGLPERRSYSVPARPAVKRTKPSTTARTGMSLGAPQPKVISKVPLSKKRIFNEYEKETYTNAFVTPQKPVFPKMSVKPKPAVTTAQKTKPATIPNNVAWEETPLFRAQVRAVQLLADLDTVKKWMEQQGFYDGEASPYISLMPELYN